ncbi:GNAT family N-acetyltransferase [Cellulomonas rhizosphaerae]|uniref:GNAT family N-acetyltransferase n=1 Tax=Cellulomonas rhizosphaerae TaxID=2293719 RepID=UPI0013143276|nr:GNAT family protein [Cellulomonas rhizosphaerae]
MLDACNESDRDESGLREMSTRFAVQDDGRPVALAGYEVWNDEVAHLGVLVVPDARGRGLALTAARTAMDHAPGLVPQWRASVENPVSAAVADRLGFVRAGGQIAIEVSRSRPARA